MDIRHLHPDPPYRGFSEEQRWDHGDQWLVVSARLEMASRFAVPPDVNNLQSAPVAAQQASGATGMQWIARSVSYLLL
jgi:hypothetical protein